VGGIQDAVHWTQQLGVENVASDVANVPGTVNPLNPCAPSRAAFWSFRGDCGLARLTLASVYRGRVQPEGVVAGGLLVALSVLMI
jgi:hypothetical protein